MMKHQWTRSQASLGATVLIAILLIVAASLRFTGFFSLPVFVNLFDDNAFLGIAAVGMTFVILSGGIDLSVGSMIGFASIASALLVEHAHWHPLTAAAAVLVCGSLFGALQGWMIAEFEIAPFLVTLAGMFFVRGAAYTLSLESVALRHPFYAAVQAARIPLFSGASIPPTALLFFIVVLVGLFLTTQTRFGRSVYAIGGNAQSALLMGLPVKRSLVSIYALSGLLSALAGLTFALYTSSGNATAALGLELDVIAAVVIGGTLLTGGQGSIIGTVLGVLILGCIQTIITFDGTLNSWWTRIVIGALLFFFVTLQKILSQVWLKRLKPVKRAGRKKSLANQAMLAALPIAICIFSIHASAQACPQGFEHARKLDSGLYQITGTGLKIGEHSSDDLPDPAPPFTAEDGSIEIYGSSLSFIRFQNRAEFENGGCFERVSLDLRQDNNEGYPLAYSHPWDVRKFRVEPKGKPAYNILVAGAMSRSGSNTFPVWPDDNISRRIFMFHETPKHQWIRDVNPIVGTVAPVWLGHSYGGNFIQVGMADQNVIHPDDTTDIAFFYDKVSDDTNNAPFKTEIFATATRDFVVKGPEIPIFQINTPAYPSLKRTVGGFLAEGPRPIEMSIGGQTFFIVTFSAGDFPTDFYTMNYAWSRSLMGPYTPALTEDGKDLLDLGKEIKAAYGLSWMGRPSIFKSPQGHYEMMFHAVMKSIRPDNDYTKWPSDLLGFYRSLFKVSLDTSVSAKGEPVIRLNPHVFVQ